MDQESAGQQAKRDPKWFLDAYSDEVVRKLQEKRVPTSFAENVFGQPSMDIASNPQNYTWQWLTMQKLNAFLKNTLLATSLKGLLVIRLKATWSRLVRTGKKELYDSVNKELQDLLLEKENQKENKKEDWVLKLGTPKT